MKIIICVSVILMNLTFIAAQSPQKFSADTSRSSEKIVYVVGDVNKLSKVSLQQANSLLGAIE